MIIIGIFAYHILMLFFFCEFLKIIKIDLNLLLSFKFNYIHLLILQIHLTFLVNIKLNVTNFIFDFNTRLIDGIF